MNILLTGGTGYIGSHTATVLAQAGHQVVLFDNLSNSSITVLHRLERITGQRLPFVQGDIRNTALLETTLRQHGIQAVIHFAGLKAVGESAEKPIDYYANNVQGSISLLQAMQAAQVYTLVFSSSATVYGQPQYLPYDENHPTAAINPYGRTKLHIEEILRDTAASHPAWHIALLRYFNPVGAHPSGLIGELPNGTPNNLMPFIAQVATGQRPHLNIFGNDYDTPDGTGVRDYIHVVDLALGHIKALDKIKETQGVGIYNLGTGIGYSVLDLTYNFQKATGVEIPYTIIDRRPGDVATCYADATKAKEELGWTAQKTLADMCRDSWNWQKNNPNGYEPV